MKKNFEKFHRFLGIFKYILPTYFIYIIDEYYKELSNYFFYKSKLIKAESDGVLDRNSMNFSEKRNKFHFVVNLNPEYLLLPKDDLVEHERLIISNEIIKMENLFAKYNLFDLLKFSYERILTDDFYAYGITCSFNFRNIKSFNNRYLIIYSSFILLSTLYLILF